VPGPLTEKEMMQIQLDLKENKEIIDTFGIRISDLSLVQAPHIRPLQKEKNLQKKKILST
jgi:hypothetical protein